MSKDENQEFEAFWDALSQENLTEAQYLDRILGPRYLPAKLVIPLTLAYVTIFVTGVVGNVITCTVIVRNAAMHTPTNYYLFSLAISDLILLVLGLPNELSIFWQQYPWALGVGPCKIRAYVSEMSSYVSVLTIVAFSMERYLAICHPLRLYASSAMKRPVRFIVAAWLVALVSAAPFAVYTRVNYVEYPPGSGRRSLDSAICAMLLPDMPAFPLYELSCLVFFLLPMLVILVFYTGMGLRIRDSARVDGCDGSAQASSAHWDSKQVQGRRSIVRMLSAVVIMFFICWAPFHAQRLLYVYAQEADYYPDLNEWLYILSGFLYYLSTTINPILYNLMSARYREAFKRTVCCGVDAKPTGRRAPRISAKETNLRRCDNDPAGNPPNGRHSIRYTIDQAKEIFRFGSGRQIAPKDTRIPVDVGRGNGTPDDNCPAQPLLSAKHPIAGQQPSNESSLSRSGLHESLSTASSLL